VADINDFMDDFYRKDTAFDKLSNKLQKEKGITKKEADEQAGKILSAAKGKGKQEKSNFQKVREQLKKHNLDIGMSDETLKEELEDEDVRKYLINVQFGAQLNTARRMTKYGVDGDKEDEEIREKWRNIKRELEEVINILKDWNR